MLQKNKAILTFDLEPWYSGRHIEKYLPKEIGHLGDFFKESILPVLILLKKKRQKATFFILGQIAQKYPQIIKKIRNQNHEIACHGQYHQPIDRLGLEEFKRQIQENKQVIKKIIQKDPLGFRAPNFSLKPSAKDFFKILKDNGFEYDSSFHPFSFGKTNIIKEIPASFGGFYFRALPLFLTTKLAQTLKKSSYPVFYFHPYELIAGSPQLKTIPYLKRKIKYIGSKSAWPKFEKLLEKYQFISIKEYLDETSSN